MENHNNIKRDRCVFCGSQNFETIKTIKNFPAYMGVYDKFDDFYFGNLTYVECSDCSSLQIEELIPLHILYQSNHNVEIVGDTWKNHYEEFSSFITENSVCSNILEIGDPGAKIAKLCFNTASFEKWTIVEPNPSDNVDLPENIVYEKCWLDDYESKNDKYDTIVMSHVFEHLYNPSDALEKIKNLLTKDGKFIISIPNMRHLIDNDSLPPSGLHFEHTYYVDQNNIKHLLSNNGFKVDNYYQYKKHSLFICCSIDSKGVSISTSEIVTGKPLFESRCLILF